jgi:hypothetical protein
MARRRLLSAGRALPAVSSGVQKDLQFTADVLDPDFDVFSEENPQPAVPPDDVEGRSPTGSPSRLQTVLRMVFPRKVKVESNLAAGLRRYERYGFRVPTVLVSPYARPDYVCSEVLDHTHVLKLVDRNGICHRLPPGTRRPPRRLASST